MGTPIKKKLSPADFAANKSGHSSSLISTNRFEILDKTPLPSTPTKPSNFLQAVTKPGSSKPEPPKYFTKPQQQIITILENEIFNGNMENPNYQQIFQHIFPSE